MYKINTTTELLNQLRVRLTHIKCNIYYNALLQIDIKYNKIAMTFDIHL